MASGQEIPPRLVSKRVKRFECAESIDESHGGDYVVRQLSATPGPGSSAPSSIPLIIPDDMVYDKEANTLTRVKGRKRRKLVPVPEALELLKQLKKQVAVLAICGPCRSGKSYVLSKMVDLPDAFKLGHQMDPETYGIWLGTSYLDFGDYAMLLLDTEGIDAVSAKGQDDVSILVMTVLLSSCLIYNSMHVPKRADVDMMGCFTQLANSIAVNQPSDHTPAKLKTSADRRPEYRSCFPNFLWLLRDVSLEIPEKQTPQQYIMDQVFPQNQAVGEAIMTLFPSVECKLLSIPTANGKILRNIEKHESELEQQFRDEVAGLIQHLRENVKKKRGFSHGHKVDGPTLVLLLEQYLEAVNTPGTIPCLEDTWNAVVEMRCGEVIHSLVKEYEREMEQALHDKLPIEEEATPEENEENEENSHPDQHQQQVFLMEVHSQILQQKKEKLLKEVKYVTPAKNAGAATRYKKELVESLQSMIIETKFDKMKGQVVTGGVIMRFVHENDKKSHEYCVKCFDEVSAPLLGNLRSITRSATVTTATPDAPRYTFQQFMDERANLQLEYFARAIGPAKQKIWEEKVAGLKEWESLVIVLDGYQEEKLKLYQRLAATAERENELREQVDQQQARSSRLETEMTHLETRLTQEHRENLQRIEIDAAERLAEESRKVEDLENRQEIQEEDLEAATEQMSQLQKEKGEAKQQQKLKIVAEIVELKAEKERKMQQYADMLAAQEQQHAKAEKDAEALEADLRKKPLLKKGKLTDIDYAMITRAWFFPDKKKLTKRDIKTECEERNIPNEIRLFTRNNLRNWMIHFGKEAVQHALVGLRRPHSLTLHDVICHK